MSAEEEKKEEPTKVADAEAPVEEKETKEVKVVKRPDETVMKEKIAVEEEKMSKLQEKLSAIKEQLDKNDSSRPDANSELGIAKAKFNTAKSESRRVQQEKRNIYDQISAADELRQQQQDLVTRLRTELQVFSVDEIERKIKQLEHKQQTTSLTIKEDKAIMEEIKKLSSGKPKIQTFKDAQDSLTGIKEHHNTLYTSLKAKNAELAIAKEAEDKVRAVMDEVRSREDAKKPDLPKLFKERDELRSSINEHRSAIRKIQNEFNAEKKEFYEYLKVVREQKNKEYNERKAAKQAEWDEYKKLLEAEEAKRDPWEEEKAICEQLIAWVQRLLPKQSGPAVEKVEIDHGSFKVMKKDEDEEMFAGLGKKKGKNKKKSVGGEAGPAAPPKSQKMKHSFDDLAVWKKLSIEAPQETGDLPAMLETLRAKQEWLKTAPPKPKKVDKAEKKGDKAEKKAEVALAEGEVVYADEMQKHLTSILHGVLAAAPADPYKEMYKGCFAASLLEGGGEVTASTMTLTSEHEAYVKKFSLQMHIDTCIAKKAKGTGPKGPFKFMMSDASDFFTDLSKKLKASGGVPTDTSMTAEELAAKDKADAEARRQKDAAAEAERDRIDAENAKRTAEMEQSGKKVSGGLHKFDAAEVDINGGNATADDFMDAFGFGGDSDAEDAPAAAAGAPDGEIVYADEMQKHLTSILHGVLAAAPADPYKEMYKGCFAASLLEGGGEVTASTMTLTSEHEAYVKKFSLQMHIDTCIAKKAKGTGPKGPFKFMMSDASDFFTDLSKKLKASGGVPTDTSMTAEELAAKDKADAEARRQKDAAAEAERDRIDAENAKRTAEMEQSGKKVSGGLHKFDASEVDINGGDATADDFMDAFGF